MFHNRPRGKQYLLVLVSAPAGSLRQGRAAGDRLWIGPRRVAWPRSRGHGRSQRPKKRRRRAPGSDDRSSGPRCAAATRTALLLRHASRVTSNTHLTNPRNQPSLKSHRHKPRLPRIHEPSHTEFSHKPVSHNGLTLEYAARNFAQLQQKRRQQRRRAHKTRPRDAPARAKRRPNTPDRSRFSHVPYGLVVET
jgi:hypothetical protein